MLDDLAPDVAMRLKRYLAVLASANQRMNLIGDPPELWPNRHLRDALELPRLKGPVIDVGSGAGLPGLVMALRDPDLSVTLLESVGKKARFLEHLVATLGLAGVEVHTARAEELAHRPELRETFDLAVSRGVASVPVLLEYTLPFCCLGGRVALLKHGGIEDELSGATPALDLLGGRLEKVHPVRVTGLAGGRVVVAFEKVYSTPAKYPRRPGMPAKRPL